MGEVQFEANAKVYTATILPNGLPGQHSVRKIVDDPEVPVTIGEVLFPFTVRLLPDDDFAILPAGTMTPANRDLLLALVTALQENES